MTGKQDNMLNPEDIENDALETEEAKESETVETETDSAEAVADEKTTISDASDDTSEVAEVADDETSEAEAEAEADDENSADVEEAETSDAAESEVVEEEAKEPDESEPAEDNEAPKGYGPVDPAELKGQLEAVLFITSKALSIADMSEIVEADHDSVEMALVELISDYSYREESSMEIDDTDGYILQVKEDYSHIVNKMMPLEISAAELRTLSAIALKAPVLQSDLIELRGSCAYDHIPELLTRKLISKRRKGRSFVLDTTRNFYEYFKLMGDKNELKGLLKEMGREPDRRRKKSREAEDAAVENSTGSDMAMDSEMGPEAEAV